MSTSLLKKFLDTLRGFYDFRALLLLAACALIGMIVDPAATLGLAGYMAYVIGMWGAAMMLSKILMPYVRLSTYARSALDGNLGAGLVVLARVLLLICIAVSFLVWGK